MCYLSCVENEKGWKNEHWVQLVKYGLMEIFGDIMKNPQVP
jgi:hypothetical protein